MLSKCTCNDNNCSKKNYALDRCYRHLLNDHMKFPEGTNNALKAHLLLDRSSQKQKIKESDQMIMNIQNELTSGILARKLSIKKIIQKFHTKFNEKTLNFNKDDIDSIKLFHDSFGTRNNNINDLINKKVKSNHVCIRVLNNMFKKLMNIYKYQDIEEKIEDSESEDSYVYTYSDQLLIDVASKVSLCHILDLFNEIEPDIDRNQTKFTDKEIHYLKKYFQNKPVPLIINEVKTKINSFQDFQIEYLEIVNNKSLQLESNYDKNKVYRAFICVSVKGVRLIDNILLN